MVYKQLSGIDFGVHLNCAYLTTGMLPECSSERRDKESIAVLKQLGVFVENIFFAGQELAIADATLPEHLNLAGNWLQKWFLGFPLLSSIYVPAWEGGHHDHDALHAMVVAIAQRLNLLPQVRQFSLYNAYKCPGPFFKVFAPLVANGLVERIKISWRQRFNFMHYGLSYPLQAKTWVGLFLFVSLHYLLNGYELLQPVSYARTKERPHVGELYYEKRKFYSWSKRLNEFLNGRINDENWYSCTLLMFPDYRY